MPVARCLRRQRLTGSPRRTPPSAPAQRRVSAPSASPTPSSATTPPTPLPIVILPGLGNASSDYASLAAALLARGAPAVAVAPVARPDWLRNAAGLLRKEYWSGDLTPAPTTDWYLERIEAAVAQARAAAGMEGGKVAVIAHSAGGWLARTWMLGGGAASVASLTTLGSPHAPPPPGCGLPDQTRGILTWVDANTPGAFHGEVLYTTVAGRYLQGAPLLGGSDGATIAARLAGAGYQALCGESDCWGDAITPVATAHLAGARQVTLEGVFHGPLGATPDPEGGEEVSAGKKARFWYGSAPVIDAWAPGALGLAPLGGRLLVGEVPTSPASRVNAK